MNPTTRAKAKKRTVFIITCMELDSGLLKPMTKVSTIMPITSSMIAALMMTVPTLLFSLPSSRSVWTVIPTDVAVIITPVKIAL